MVVYPDVVHTIVRPTGQYSLDHALLLLIRAARHLPSRPDTKPFIPLFLGTNPYGAAQGFSTQMETASRTQLLAQPP